MSGWIIKNAAQISDHQWIIVRHAARGESGVVHRADVSYTQIFNRKTRPPYFSEDAE